MELSFKINKSPEFIFDYLTDMQKFVSVHPVITKIELLENNKYLVHETLKFGFLPISFTYYVTIESNLDEKIVIIRATVMKFTKIEMNFKLKTDQEFCIVEEKIQFKSPLPIKRIMQNIFRKQHTLLFQNIEKV
ncbi:MAG: SRPBCC domain-containing protein [Bacteroidota bacterium]